MTTSRFLYRCMLSFAVGLSLTIAGQAQTPQPASPPTLPLPLSARTVEKRTEPVRFPLDARPHDASASIEWWYYWAFLKTESGKDYAVIGSYFRTGIGEKKGHYLIHSLIDLSAKKRYAASILDKSNLLLLKSFLPMAAMAKPDDPRPMQLLGMVQKGKLPQPHTALDSDAEVKKTPHFSIAMAGSSLIQTSEDARTWDSVTRGMDKANPFQLEMTLAQPTRPEMLAGSEDGTGFLKKVDQMYYLSLTRMNATGSLTIGNATEKVTGLGWIDRQWGSPGYITNYGWDWFGLQLEDGSDLIFNRIRDAITGKVVEVQATILDKDGKQIVETPTIFKPLGLYNDKETGISFPAGFTVTLPKSGYTLEMRPAFADQTIPVLGVGTAIWEGVVTATGTRNGTPVTGRGFMELVGYQPSAVKANKTTK